MGRGPRLAQGEAWFWEGEAGMLGLSLVALALLDLSQKGSWLGSLWLGPPE